MPVVTIDLGGTHARVARVEEGLIKQYVALDCDASGSQQCVINQLFSLIDQVLTPMVNRICIGVPSVVDFQKGIVYDVQNIPSWKEVPLKDIMEEKYQVETRVDNDVNCYVLGEKYFGSGRGYHDLVGITLGTGVGAGIIVNDAIYRGADTGAGEIGCLPYLDANYEQYCSAQWMKRHGIDAHQLSQRAFRGDGKALSLWQEFGFHLGKFMQVVLLAYNPEAILIGGGISGGAAFFKDSMIASMADHFPYQREIDNIHIHFSTVADSNLLGASKL